MKLFGLCNEIKYIKCYFGSYNFRSEIFGKYEVGGFFFRGDRVCLRVFVFLDSEDTVLGVLI